MTSGLSQRPWPRPSEPAIMRQTWRDLLFAHWPVSPESLRALVPPALPLDVLDGQAWIGVVPFRITGLRPRGLPALPWLSAFPELNVRTYVTLDGKPGVYFFSLDAGNAVAVAAARLAFNLPYFRAKMSPQERGGMIHYASRRTRRDSGPATFIARYWPTGDQIDPRTASLADWLTARYCLYVVDRRGSPRRLEIDHPIWPLQPAEAEIDENTMTEPLGLRLPETAPLLHFSRRLDVVTWPTKAAGHESSQG